MVSQLYPCRLYAVSTVTFDRGSSFAQLPRPAMSGDAADDRLHLRTPRNTSFLGASGRNPIPQFAPTARHATVLHDLDRVKAR